MSQIRILSVVERDTSERQQQQKGWLSDMLKSQWVHTAVSQHCRVGVPVVWSAAVSVAVPAQQAFVVAAEMSMVEPSVSCAPEKHGQQ